MLFLAVFCGFLAEYQLEHIIEHQREKKFARLLLSDLRADSAFFAKRIVELNSTFQKHQDLYQIMTGPAKASDKEIINKCYAVYGIFEVLTTTATYDQMKASGSLRYIQNEELIKPIQQYYEVLLPGFEKATEMEHQYFNDFITPFSLKHFRV